MSDNGYVLEELRACPVATGGTPAFPAVFLLDAPRVCPVATGLSTLMEIIGTLEAPRVCPVATGKTPTIASPWRFSYHSVVIFT